MEFIVVPIKSTALKFENSMSPAAKIAGKFMTATRNNTAISEILLCILIFSSIMIPYKNTR
jgi:hypothetical protein